MGQRASYAWQLQHHENLKKLALKINRMSEGAVTQPVALSEDPGLLADASQSLALAQPEPVMAHALSREMCGLVRDGQDGRIVELLKSASLADINAVTAVAWEAMVPVLVAWAGQRNPRDREPRVMAFSIAYHVMQFCPEVLARPALAGFVSRLAVLCNDQLQTGNGFQDHGGLSVAELRGLAVFLQGAGR